MEDIRRVIASFAPIGALQTLSNGDELRFGIMMRGQLRSRL